MKTATATRRNAFRALVSGAALLAVLFTSGCNTASTQSNLTLFVENAPLPTLVARGGELTAAQAEARRHRGSFAVLGEGSSMEPVYVAGTALVIRAGGYQTLRPGMPVVYANTRGVSVAHMVVEQTNYGWVAVGLNNESHDSELVTADNLVGVITHAFASQTGSLPQEVAARMALNDQIRRGAKVASLGR
ncbi:S24/S26 family peptidase [Opitutus terrae]|uniref:Peptidase S24/S26A/S26B/S26C domain-containing protein n=1 Tax=Opitutus terrae (strain DSM 11246 / JCM 15787 / PB90-1) TaxID=452637 RepID=B1ZVQ0_OPITP|nr:S24/S26 family peptidase [Opitutus terrae]ACB74986.1 hypothetical protein Oter_1702 [Opitutus terrae PB90-1]